MNILITMNINWVIDCKYLDSNIYRKKYAIGLFREMKREVLF